MGSPGESSSHTDGSGGVYEQAACPSIHPSILGVTIATFGSSLLLAQPVWWRHHGERASSKHRVFFILHHLRRISFSTEHHCRAKLSAAQWDTDKHKGAWSALVCPGRNPIYLLSNLLWHTGSDLTWHLLILAATTSVGVPWSHSTWVRGGEKEMLQNSDCKTLCGQSLTWEVPELQTLVTG